MTKSTKSAKCDYMVIHYEWTELRIHGTEMVMAMVSKTKNKATAVWVLIFPPNMVENQKYRWNWTTILLPLEITGEDHAILAPPRTISQRAVETS
jgi:hypothetical protein